MIRALAASVLMLAAASAAGAELGRLFLTPAQRATLDNARRQNLRVEVGEEKPAAPLPQNMRVDGVVRSSDGSSTVWLNSRPVTGRSTDGINVSPGKDEARVRLSVPNGGRSVDLKVGQSVEIVSGSIQEDYSRRVPVKADAAASAGPANAAAPRAATAPAPAPSKASPTDVRAADGDSNSDRRADPR